MSTDLARIEGVDLDAVVECEVPRCPSAAEWLVRWVPSCGCVHQPALFCDPHMLHFMQAAGRVTWVCTRTGRSVVFTVRAVIRL